jgi:hypothetical protein
MLTWFDYLFRRELNRPPLNEEERKYAVECVICGVAIKSGQRYCGASCEQYDENEPCSAL